MIPAVAVPHKFLINDRLLKFYDIGALTSCQLSSCTAESFFSCSFNTF
jgi:hypothetical protein